MADTNPASSIRSELAAARDEFGTLLDSLSAQEWRRQSLNPGWTNSEIAFHMALGFFLIPSLIGLIRLFSRLPGSYSRAFSGALNASTRPFNWINALGPRIGGRLFNNVSLRRLFDRVFSLILRIVDRIPASEWQSGMYYPHRLDGLFSEYMTIEALFHYVVAHFRFHLGQIAR